MASWPERNAWEFRRKPPGKRRGSDSRPCRADIPACLNCSGKPNPRPSPATSWERFARSTGRRTTLYSRASELVGDRNPREHEFSIQLRAFDTNKTGSSLGVAALLAIRSALINKSLRGGMVVPSGINLGGSIDPLHNAIDVVELAVEKGASVVLMPVSSRKQLFDLSDDIATKVTVVFYNDAREALIKAISD